MRRQQNQRKKIVDVPYQVEFVELIALRAIGQHQPVDPPFGHSNDASEGSREVNMAKRFEKTPAPRARARQTNRARLHRNMQNYNPSVRFDDESPTYDPRRSRVADA